MSLAAVIAVLVITLACANSRNPAADGSTPPRGERIPDEVPSPADRVQAEPVYDDAYSGIDERRRAVVRTESDWREIWDELAGRQLPPPEPPAVDFDRRMVIVAAMGSRPTGGYGIAIEDVHAADGRLYVTIFETSPGEGCMTTQAFTAPAVAVSVARRPGEPTFVERTETGDC